MTVDRKEGASAQLASASAVASRLRAWGHCGLTSAAAAAFVASAERPRLCSPPLRLEASAASERSSGV